MYHSRAEIFSGDRIRVTGATKGRQSIDPWRAWMESGAWILRKLKRKRKDGRDDVFIDRGGIFRLLAVPFEAAVRE